MQGKEELIKRIEALEQELKESRQIFETTFENTGNATILINEDTKIIFLNTDFEKLTGYSREEIIGKMSWADFVIPKDIERMMGYHRMRRENPKAAPRNYDFGFKNRAGDIRNIYMTIDMIPGTKMSIGSFTDVTDKRKLEGDLLKISEQERQEIGNDLHDGLAPHLVGVQFMVKVLKQNLESGGHVNLSDIDEINDHLAEAIKHIRKLSKGFRPVDIQNDGLIFALSDLSSNTEAIFGIKCAFNYDENFLISENIVATHLYYIVKEAVNNSVKHGKCSSIKISLRIMENSLDVTIEDDGIGLEGRKSEEKGMGLNIMRYRARIIGADLTIDKSESGGVRIVCRLNKE